MTNSKHLVKCPYYEYEKENFIKCEDVKRSFKWIKQKDDYMYAFCDENWKKCEHAIRLEQAYKEGRDMEQVKNESLRSEYRKLERRLKQSEARNIAKDEDIKKLRKRCKLLEGYRNKYFEAEAHEKNVAKEVMALTAMYEARLAYLMAEYADGVLNEKEMAEWSKDKEFAFIADEKDNDKVSQWRVIVRFADDERSSENECSSDHGESDEGSEYQLHNGNESDGGCETDSRSQ